MMPNNNDEKKNKFFQKIKDYIGRNLLEIEKRDDISIDERSSRTIHLFSATFPVTREMSHAKKLLHEQTYHCDKNDKRLRLQ